MDAKPKLLIVEDCRSSRLTMVLPLKAHAEIDEAEDGATALGLVLAKAVERKVYDLILLDIHMPRVDGLDVLRILRKTEKRFRLPRTKVIMITAQAEQLMDAATEVIDDYLIKPCRTEEILEKLRRFELIAAEAAHDPAALRETVPE